MRDGGIEHPLTAVPAMSRRSRVTVVAEDLRALMRLADQPVRLLRRTVRATTRGRFCVDADLEREEVEGLARQGYRVVASWGKPRLPQSR